MGLAILGVPGWRAGAQLVQDYAGVVFTAYLGVMFWVKLWYSTAGGQMSSSSRLMRAAWRSMSSRRGPTCRHTSMGGWVGVGGWVQTRVGQWVGGRAWWKS